MKEERVSLLQRLLTRKKKLLFFLIAAVLLTPWPVAYAYDNGLAQQTPVRIEAAAAGTTAWTAYGNAIGGVSAPVDIFYVDAADSPLDTSVTLHLTNAYELSRHYRYLILKVGVYAQDAADEWERATSRSGEVFPDTYLTMRNGNVSFPLAGYAKYKLTIDGGSFYCNTAAADGGIAPQFYLSAERGIDGDDLVRP